MINLGTALDDEKRVFSYMCEGLFLHGTRRNAVVDLLLEDQEGDQAGSRVMITPAQIRLYLEPAGR